MLFSEIHEKPEIPNYSESEAQCQMILCSDHVKKVHKKVWSNDDIRVDRAELALMKKIVTEQCDRIQGYVTTEGNKAKKKVLLKQLPPPPPASLKNEDCFEQDV